MKRTYVIYNGCDLYVVYSIDKDDPSTGYRGEGIVIESIELETAEGHVDVTYLLLDAYEQIIKLIEL